jgi:hypothetical protein
VPESRSRKKKSSYTPPEKTQSTAKKGNPPWLVPTMVTLMLVGLVWVVVTYMFSAAYPIPNIGNGNLLIGFAFIVAGFSLTTRWQ